MEKQKNRMPNTISNGLCILHSRDFGLAQFIKANIFYPENENTMTKPCHLLESWFGLQGGKTQTDLQ